MGSLFPAALVIVPKYVHALDDRQFLPRTHKRWHALQTLGQLGLGLAAGLQGLVPSMCVRGLGPTCCNHSSASS